MKLMPASRWRGPCSHRQIQAMSLPLVVKSQTDSPHLEWSPFSDSSDRTLIFFRRRQTNKLKNITNSPSADARETQIWLNSLMQNGLASQKAEVHTRSGGYPGTMVSCIFGTVSPNIRIPAFQTKTHCNKPNVSVFPSTASYPHICISQSTLTGWQTKSVAIFWDSYDFKIQALVRTVGQDQVEFWLSNLFLIIHPHHSFCSPDVSPAEHPLCFVITFNTRGCALSIFELFIASAAKLTQTHSTSWPFFVIICSRELSICNQKQAIFLKQYLMTSLPETEGQEDLGLQRKLRAEQNLELFFVHINTAARHWSDDMGFCAQKRLKFFNRQMQMGPIQNYIQVLDENWTRHDGEWEGNDTFWPNNVLFLFSPFHASGTTILCADQSRTFRMRQCSGFLNQNQTRPPVQLCHFWTGCYHGDQLFLWHCHGTDIARGQPEPIVTTRAVTSCFENYSHNARHNLGNHQSGDVFKTMKGHILFWPAI